MSSLNCARSSSTLVFKNFRQSLYKLILFSLVSILVSSVFILCRYITSLAQYFNCAGDKSHQNLSFETVYLHPHLQILLLMF